MPISIKGINTGVIRQKNEFIALALKIKETGNKESLFFLSPLGLRDLFIALESRLYAKSLLRDDERQHYEKACARVSKKMHENIPLIQEGELKNADINRRINSLILINDKGEHLTLSLTLHDGQTCELLINELQINVLTHAIIHAINNAGMRELALRITSLLDFLPLYDVDCQKNDNLEYDSYEQPEWKQHLFNHYLAVLYRYEDETGNTQFCGSVVKTRTPSGSKEVKAISRRLLDFSPRLKKLVGAPCQVFVRTLTDDKTQKLTQEQCLRALHHLRVQSMKKAKNA